MSRVQEQSSAEWLNEYCGSTVARIKPAIRDQETSQTEPKSIPAFSFEGTVEGHDWVPEGEYWVSYREHKIERQPRYGYKLVVYFNIWEGKHSGKIIRAFYNLEESRKGLVMREGCRWANEMRELFPELASNAIDPLKTPDPLPVSLIQNKIIFCKIETAKNKKKKKDHTRPYSVVRRLIRIED